MIESTRNLIEAAGASPLAAAIRLRDTLAGKRVALIASGGNASRTSSASSSHFRRSTARWSEALFIFERPSIPMCFASS